MKGGAVARAIIMGMLLAPLVAGCALLDRKPRLVFAPDPLVSTADMPGALEPIHAAAFIADHAIFRVSSGGCTERDDIQPIVTFVDDQAVVTLRRMQDDYCQAYAEDGVELIWTFEELGLAPGQRVRVNNPYLDGV